MEPVTKNGLPTPDVSPQGTQERVIKSEDVKIGTKRTMTGKYSAQFLYEGQTIYRMKQSFRKREDAVEHAKRVLEITPILALQTKKL